MANDDDLQIQILAAKDFLKPQTACHGQGMNLLGGTEAS